MGDRKQTETVPSYPVSVIESIPVAGAHGLDEARIREEAVPTPVHLRVFEEFARGGMGRIHPATDRHLLRHVALKRLDSAMAAEPFYRDGFIAEAQITGQLEHPNIVPVHELAIADNGVPYFTMKLVQGVSFDAWLHDAEHVLGSAERLEHGIEILLKVCDALAYAHHRGVIHRDLKPANVMVGEFGQVYLMDWGLARLTRSRPASGSQAQMEAPGAVGTPEYMAPEQAHGNPADMDELSDVFGLGAMLYELVSGRRPYGNLRDPQLVLDQAKQGNVVPIQTACMGLRIPRSLQEIVTRATAPTPANRYPSVAALKADLQAFLRGGLHLPRRVFGPGAEIIREGDLGDAAYMIVSGSCRAYRTVGGRQETLATMGPGDVFGEMALLLDEPRAATVVSESVTVVLVLDKKTIGEGLGVNGWAGALVRALAHRFRDLELRVRNSGMLRE